MLMQEIQKYQELTKIFLKRLIILEREIEETQDKLKGDGLVRIYIETDIIPFDEMDDVLGITEDNVGEKLFEDLTEIEEKSTNETIDDDLKKFIEKYV